MKTYTYKYSFPDISEEMYTVTLLTKPSYLDAVATGAADHHADLYNCEHCCTKRIRIYDSDDKLLGTKWVAPTIVEYEVVDDD